jgi:hypothetical protein
LKQGSSFKEIVERLKEPKVKYKGVEYKSIRSACKDLNLDYKKVLIYITKYNKSFQEAVELIKKSDLIKEDKVIEYEGVKYKSLFDLLSSLGFRSNYKNLARMYADGKPLNEVIEYGRFSHIKNKFKINTKYILREGTYYKCECKKCGVKDLLSVSEMEEHECGW